MATLWVKIDVEMPFHPKLFGRPVWQRHFWTCLICLAKQHFAETGIIRGYSATDFAKLFNLCVPASTVKKVLKSFATAKMVRQLPEGAIDIIDFLDRNPPLEARDRAMVVYFIRDESTGLIKIGTSKNPWARLSSLQTATRNKLTMLGTVKESGFGHEADIHRRFAAFRSHGEWFTPAPALLSYLSHHGLATVAMVAGATVAGEPAGEVEEEVDLEKEKNQEVTGEEITNVGGVASKTAPPRSQPWDPALLAKLKSALGKDELDAGFQSFLLGASRFPAARREAATREFLARGCAAENKGERYLLAMIRDGAGARRKPQTGEPDPAWRASGFGSETEWLECKYRATHDLPLPCVLPLNWEQAIRADMQALDTTRNGHG